jgi:hypothetical protein
VKIDFIVPKDFDNGIQSKELEIVTSYLYDRHESRYEQQAIKFLQSQRVIVQVRDALILYDFDEGLAWAQISLDGGKDWSQLMGFTLDGPPADDIWRLKHLFAQSEGRLILDV